jgi:hypothetical protein
MARAGEIRSHQRHQRIQLPRLRQRPEPKIYAERYRLPRRLRRSRQRLVRAAYRIIQQHHRRESLPFQQAAHVALRNLPRSLALFWRTKNLHTPAAKYKPRLVKKKGISSSQT